MRKWILPAAVVAALATVAIDAAPAKAQEVRVWYPSSGYYGGYAPAYYGYASPGFNGTYSPGFSPAYSGVVPAGYTLVPGYSPGAVMLSTFPGMSYGTYGGYSTYSRGYVMGNPPNYPVYSSGYSPVVPASYTPAYSTVATPVYVNSSYVGRGFGWRRR